MADIIFNIARGKIGYYAELPAANDGLLVVPIETTGLEADATLRDYDNLSALLAGTSNEQTTMGRRALTLVTVTVDDTLEEKRADFDDPSWAAPTGNNVSKLLVCYDPDVAAGDDTTIIPLTCHDFIAIPNGTPLTAKVFSTGFWKSGS